MMNDMTNVRRSNRSDRYICFKDITGVKLSVVEGAMAQREIVYFRDIRAEIISNDADFDEIPMVSWWKKQYYYVRLEIRR